MARAITYCGTCGVRVDIETRRLAPFPKLIPVISCSACARQRIMDPDIVVVEEWLDPTPAEEE